MAAGMLFEEFCRLYTKMKGLQNAEHDMLKPKVTSQHSNWHLNCQEILIKTHRNWIRANRHVNWVSKAPVEGLQDEKNRSNYCRLEYKARLSRSQGEIVSSDLDDFIRRKDQQAKIKTLMERYKRLVDDLNKFTNESVKYLNSEAKRRTKKQLSERQSRCLQKRNNWMSYLREFQDETSLESPIG